MDQIGLKWIKMDQIRPNEPNWTEMSVYYLYLLKFMKMTYDSLSRSRMGPFNLDLNITLAYIYEYSYRI